MGLDISAANKLEYMADFSDPDLEGFFVSQNDDDFADRADGLKPGIYRAEKMISFRAGSYGGYSDWREKLAELAGYAPLPHRSSWEQKATSRFAAGAWAAKEGPFWELINFTDCDGTIGPKTAAKLAKDFVDFQLKADALENDYFSERYADWRRAFELASDGGAVHFH